MWYGSAQREKVSFFLDVSSGFAGVSEFCAWRLASSGVMAGNWFTFVRKHKAHRGAVWEGSRRKNLVSQFCACRLASSAEGRVISSLMLENTKRTGLRYGRVQRQKVWFLLEFVWFLVEFASCFIRLSEFCAWQLASSAVGRVICAR